MNLTRDDFDTVVDCVRCDDGEVTATFYDRPSLWFFGACSCNPAPYTESETKQLETRGECAMEAAHDRAHR